MSVVQFEPGTAINGVALAEIHPSTYPERFFNHQALGVIRSYTNKLYKGKELFLVVGNEVHAVTTDSNGKFGLWLNGDFPDNVKLYLDASCKISVPILQHYPVYFPLADHPLEVISDVDDTILYSFTNTIIRRIFTILLKSPENRKMVEFTSHLLSYARKSGIRVYCISKSEMNLFHILTDTLALNGISDAIVHLFDYLSYLQLLGRKGKNFKLGQIVNILQKSPGKRYYLIGDDAQQDIRTYSEAAEMFPGRICHVFIRQTKAYNFRFQRFYSQRLNKMNVPISYFDEATSFDSSMLAI